MKLRSIMRYGIVIVILGLMVGCGEDNSVPVINSFTVNATEVVIGAEVELVVLATDPDGDDLTYTYESLSGEIIGEGNMVKWVSPETAGSYIITVDVTDGELNVQDLVTIVVTPETPDASEAPEGMVLIPAGEFQMGDSFNEGQDDELPVHTVYLYAFYMDIYEVTNAQYAAFLNAYGKNTDDSGNELLNIDSSYCLIEQVGGTYRAKSGNKDHPMIEVSWYGANAYAEFYGKRIPTEAEWEKAARGGLVGKRYSWGDSISHDDANYGETGGKDIWAGISPVGSFDLNGYGLYDMAGNVWEWCADWFDTSYYANLPPNDSLGADSGTYRVSRGGSWTHAPYYLRVSGRYSNYPAYSFNHTGFRCAMSRSD